MTESVMDSFSTNPVLRDHLFVPFVIYAELLINGYGKRQERHANYRRLANKIESELENYADGQSYTVEFSKPTKYTFQFGDNYPKITINGNIRRDTAPKQHKDSVCILQANEYKIGYGSANAYNSNPNAKMDQYAKQIYDSVMEQVGEHMAIKSIEVGGIMYGKGGRSIQ